MLYRPLLVNTVYISRWSVSLALMRKARTSPRSTVTRPPMVPEAPAFCPATGSGRTIACTARKPTVTAAIMRGSVLRHDVAFMCLSSARLLPDRKMRTSIARRPASLDRAAHILLAKVNICTEKACQWRREGFCAFSERVSDRSERPVRRGGSGFPRDPCHVSDLNLDSPYSGPTLPQGESRFHGKAYQRPLRFGRVPQ